MSVCVGSILFSHAQIKIHITTITVFQANKPKMYPEPLGNSKKNIKDTDTRVHFLSCRCVLYIYILYIDIPEILLSINV